MARIRILGGGWYGCHLALALSREQHDVELHEKAPTLFAGASGGNPARLHLGYHYPRSKATREASQAHYEAFMEAYGFLTRPVPVNIYAIAAQDSLIDFDTYRQILAAEVEFVTIHDPREYGLQNVEGALLTGERHILVDKSREFFARVLNSIVRYNTPLEPAKGFDWTIDCTFCARDAENIDRYEPCLTVLLEGPTDRAVTIMDGPFGSIYPWSEERKLSSLTSASLTPFSKALKSHSEAREILQSLTKEAIERRGFEMLHQMARFWPAALELYKIVDHRLTIRAQPRSGSDARLIEVIETDDRTLRIRAGKIDAILHAREMLRQWIP